MSEQNDLIITEYRHAPNGRTYLLCGLFSNRRMIEVHLQERGNPSLLGNIYIGRVDRVAKNLNAAFVEFQPGINGYLPLTQVKDPVYIHKSGGTQPVQGDELLVQVERESVKSKLPTLTTNLNLTGIYLVLTSQNRKLGVSKKIGGERKRKLQALFENETYNDHGLIIRTNAQDAADIDIRREYQKLLADYQRLLHDSAYRTCFSCLRQSEPEYKRILRNVRYRALARILTDLPDIYEELLRIQGEVEGLAQAEISLWTAESYSLSAFYNMGRQLERALGKYVWLPCGGYLVIEPTEALTVIDVNTGKSTAKKNSEEHFLSVNREAAREAASQLRLRNISGIVIIDFIDMKSTEAKKELLQTLKEAVREDPVPVQIVGFTGLNLVELTRKKVSKNLMEQLT